MGLNRFPSTNHVLNNIILQQKAIINLDPLWPTLASTAAASAVKRRRDSGNPNTSSESVNTNENAFVASKTLLLLEK